MILSILMQYKEIVTLISVIIGIIVGGFAVLRGIIWIIELVAKEIKKMIVITFKEMKEENKLIDKESLNNEFKTLKHDLESMIENRMNNLSRVIDGLVENIRDHTVTVDSCNKIHGTQNTEIEIIKNEIKHMKERIAA